VSEGSSLYLYALESAVKSPSAPILMEQGTPTVTAEIERVQRDLILDTGSNISILQPGISRSDIRCTSIKPYGITGVTLVIRGQQNVSFVFDIREFKYSFYICSLPTKAAGLIGMDFKGKTGAKIYFGKGEISLAVVSKGQKMVPSSPARQAALTFFPQDKEGHSPHPRQQVKQEKDKKIKHSSGSEPTSSWLKNCGRNGNRAKVPADSYR